MTRCSSVCQCLASAGEDHGYCGGGHTGAVCPQWQQAGWAERVEQVTMWVVESSALWEELYITIQCPKASLQLLREPLMGDTDPWRMGWLMGALKDFYTLPGPHECTLR